jgi:hypothetical protein
MPCFSMRKNIFISLDEKTEGEGIDWSGHLDYPGYLKNDRLLFRKKGK